MPEVSDKINLLLDELMGFLIEIESEPVLSIHGIRKRTKYIRALLAIPPKPAPTINTTMKIVSKILAPYRDAQVNLDTYRIVMATGEIINDPGLESLLTLNPYLLKQHPEPDQIAELKTQLNIFKSQYLISPFNITRDHILKAVSSSYLSASEQMKRAERNTNSRTIHVWRKKAKRLWYQLRFLFGDFHENPNHPLCLSQTLGRILGEIHDLDELDSTLSLSSSRAFQQIIASKRQALLRDAYTMGQWQFINQSSAFYQTLKQSQ